MLGNKASRKHASVLILSFIFLELSYDSINRSINQSLNCSCTQNVHKTTQDWNFKKISTFVGRV